MNISPLLKFPDVFIIIFVLLIGVILGLITPQIKKVIPKFTKRIKFLERYWLFVVLFLLVLSLGYILIFLFTPDVNKELVINIYNHVSALVFAIFVGYFAFLEVSDYRFEKVQEKAISFLQEGNYPRAIKAYEECLKINADDFDDWGNLMELYLIQSQYDVFEDNLKIVRSKIKYVEDDLALLYLLAAKELMRERKRDAKKAIKDIIDFVKYNPSALKHFNWTFKQIEECDVFSQLGEESTLMFKNLAKYLLRQLSEGAKGKFENGDYELKPPSPSTSPSVAVLANASAQAS